MLWGVLRGDKNHSYPLVRVHFREGGRKGARWTGVLWQLSREQDSGLSLICKMKVITVSTTWGSCDDLQDLLVRGQSKCFQSVSCYVQKSRLD